MMKQTISSPIRKLKLFLILPLIAGIFYAFAAPEYRFENATERQDQENPLYFISKEKIDIPFTPQLRKTDLEIIKSELAKAGFQIDYTSLDFWENGNLKQISATVKQPSGNVTFTSGKLTPTNYPTFRTASDGSFGIYYQKAVTGKVISENGSPLKGASVIISGKTIGTITDADGSFKLILTDASPIVISYVGFESIKVNPDFEKEMQINMKKATISIKLDDQATTKVKKEPVDLMKSNALIIIDGKETTKAEMEKINPEKIESVSVLKGESATKLYGDKGKDGVVLITMKKEQVFETKTQTTNIKSTFIKLKSNGPDSVLNLTPNSLIYINDKLSTKADVDQLEPSQIDYINVLKDQSAIALYGEKGKNGVILITMKKGATATKNEPIDVKVTGYASEQKANQPNPGIQIRNTGTSKNESKPLIVIDGVIDENQNLDKINPETIESVNVIKNEESTKKYGEKGKNGVLEIKLKKPGAVFTVIEEMPEFPGGSEAINPFIKANLQYPEKAIASGISGKVFVNFIISKTGKVENVKVTRSLHPLLDEEAVRVIKLMPNWKPGTQNGEKIDVIFNVPVTFNNPNSK